MAKKKEKEKDTTSDVNPLIIPKKTKIVINIENDEPTSFEDQLNDEAEISDRKKAEGNETSSTSTLAKEVKVKPSISSDDDDKSFSKVMKESKSAQGAARELSENIEKRKYMIYEVFDDFSAKNMELSKNRRIISQNRELSESFDKVAKLMEVTAITLKDNVLHAWLKEYNVEIKKLSKAQKKRDRGLIDI